MSSGDVVARTVMMLLPQKPALVHTSLHWLPNACTASHRPALAHRHLHWFTQAFIGSHTPALAFRCLHMVQKACFGSLAFTGITKRLHWFTRACSASNRPALGLQNACIHSQNKCHWFIELRTCFFFWFLEKIMHSSRDKTRLNESVHSVQAKYTESVV